jgi:hypothetical protein
MLIVINGFDRENVDFYEEEKQSRMVKVVLVETKMEIKKFGREENTSDGLVVKNGMALMVIGLSKRTVCGDGQMTIGIQSMIINDKNELILFAQLTNCSFV